MGDPPAAARARESRVNSARAEVPWRGNGRDVVKQHVQLTKQPVCGPRSSVLGLVCFPSNNVDLST